ncbi:MAG TPA: hypothetical protein VFP84_38180 [Kofleriaceae bacterium]|nr:hypothetical protein [Kofleriaceae bacterium]
MAPAIGTIALIAASLAAAAPAVASPFDPTARDPDAASILEPAVSRDVPAPRGPSPVDADPEVALPYATRARHAEPGVLVTSRGGYDASSHAAVMAGVVEATVIDRVAVHAAIAQDAASTRSHASGGIAVDVLRQATSGVDLAVAGEYDAQGWNRVPAVVARVAFGRRVGALQLVGNAALGVATQDGERYGELELAALAPVAERLGVGFDSHAALDLERDAEEPAAEPDWGVQAGPVATYRVGPVALSAFAGVSSWKLRLANQTYTGAIGSLGAAMGF